MKKLAGLLALVAMFTFGFFTYTDMTSAAGMEGAAAAKTVKGEVQKIEGENYTVKDDAGKEVKLHVSADTQKQGDIKVGDKIEAQADATGHALSIKAAK
jgi:hypothetical protein